MQEVRFYTPHVSLQDFVQCIMLVDARTGPEDPVPVCLYPPTPQSSLFFYMEDAIRVLQDGGVSFVTQPRCVVVGHQTRPVTLDIGRHHKAVRVGFHPGGLHRLLGLPMHELLDGSYDGEDVFGREIRDVNERLQAAVGPDAIHQVVEAFLLGKAKDLASQLPFDLALRTLVQHQGNLSMAEVASLACLSLRQLERMSNSRLGLSPKVFARVVRFSKAYRLHQEQPALRWTDIAYQSGYFDQMHLIRDFKVFTGLPPGRIERELAETPVRLQAGMRL